MTDEQRRQDLALQAMDRLQKFLAEFREPDGTGWAPVTEGDMELFHRLMQAIIEAKFGSDVDGDRPIDYILIDRTKYWPLHYMHIPYYRTAEDEGGSNLDDCLDTALANMSIAVEQVQQITRMKRSQPK